ncbi:hypothetical protein [Acetobacter lambici]|uniref:Uncharacterized protein n=2 Tax=Acetobacter lambici TaxID=1332824 RepID=A0ABT1F232_9PROT|nr:hypothetical protein [Acetobacter lambici]MCP1259272.1 hypothetical protein [Acetobacter lambici]
MRKHSVMVGNRVLYYAAQLSHAQRFARARQAEGIEAYVVPDKTPPRARTVRMNPLTGQPYNSPRSGKRAVKHTA